MILLSPEKRLPEAETTTNLRSGSDSTIALTFLNCSAEATDEPPNFAILIMCVGFRSDYPRAAINEVGSAASAASSAARASTAVRSRTSQAPGAYSSAPAGAQVVRST